MARVVYGFGSSHSPQLSIPPEDWHVRGEADRRIRELIGTDGVVSDYAGLLERTDVARIRKEITPEKISRRHEQDQKAIRRLAESLNRVRSDVLVMVGDDQQEYLRDDNMPGICVYWGDEVKVKGNPEIGAGTDNIIGYVRPLTAR